MEEEINSIENEKKIVYYNYFGFMYAKLGKKIHHALMTFARKQILRERKDCC